MEATADARNLLRLQRTVLSTSSAAGTDSIQCPSCDATLKRSEVAQHCEQELRQLQTKVAETVATSSVSNGAAAAENVEEDGTENSAEQRRKPWTVFQRVQRNRQSRLKQRSRKRPAAPPTAAVDQMCPICNLNYPQEEIQRHAEQCLRRSSSTNGRGGDDSSNEDDDVEYEEYEWAGQKRIRVSSLLQGGYAAIGIGQSLSSSSSSSSHNGNGGSGLQQQQNGNDDDEEDLNVDEDDTRIYGPAQYGESDVITPAGNAVGHGGDVNGTTDEGDLTNYMRRLITDQNHQHQRAPSNHNHNANAGTQVETDAAVNANNIPQVVDDNNEDDDNDVADDAIAYTLRADEADSPPRKQEQQQLIIDSLKAKLRHYENHVQSKFKCLICLDDYRNPAISVCCWHVHCEACWLRSLGARKLCPQCNLITTPKDLRRIYM